MPFELNQQIERGEPDLVITHKNGAPDPDGDPSDAIRVWIDPLLGGHSAEIMDQMISLDKRMNGNVRSGTTERMKVIRCVSHMENLVLDGKPVELFTKASYDRCPNWILAKIRAKVREKNNEVEELEQE